MAIPKSASFSSTGGFIGSDDEAEEEEDGDECFDLLMAALLSTLTDEDDEEVEVEVEVGDDDGVSGCEYSSHQA